MKQISFRVTEELFQDFHKTILDRKTKQAKVLQEVVQSWVKYGQLPRESKEGSSEHYLRDLGAQIAAGAASMLGSDLGWIQEAMRRVELQVPQTSIFGSRIEHFDAEKQFLSTRFVPWIAKRIVDRLLVSDVVLLVDSGTTLYWAFRMLEELLQRIPDGSRKLSIYTNNVPGILEFEKRSGQRGVQREPLCHLLPGRVLTRYMATSGDETVRTVDSLRRSHPQAAFLVLLSASWILLHRDAKGPTYPAPLLKGYGGLLELKESMVRLGDEIYLVAPLGKVFRGTNLARVNAALKLDPNSADPDKSAYRQMGLDEKTGELSEVMRPHIEKIRLVSTSRADSRLLLHSHSVAVSAQLNAHSADTNAPSADEVSPHWLIPFDQYASVSPEDQKALEFPHIDTRTPSFMATFFQVPTYK